jgi:alkaline phosphatase D
MSRITRRSFIQMAAALGATAAWATPFGSLSDVPWRESRDFYPEGVASGDPAADGVILWTRRPPQDKTKERKLTVEVATGESFKHVVAKANAPISEASDWTCRVLVGGLKPSQVYWYRFTDSAGNGSRVGRTITAPTDGDAKPVRFAFVSCQNANFGAMNAYRRMIFEDERAKENDRLGFVLHLGDFFYELVWYPEDRQTYYDRKVREIVRYEHGEKIEDFHIPTTVADYRAIYRSYLHDPDLQDARARWPFVCMWDNHEFSWQGWQSLQRFGEASRPAQTMKVAAMQAYFEYQPGRFFKSSGPSLDQFDPPKVVDVPVTKFDEHGLGQEPNNLAAINSLRGYRAMRWGRNVELIITDQRSYRSEDPYSRKEGDALGSESFTEFTPQELMEAIDGGRSYNGGNPPATLRFGKIEIPNFRRDEAPQTFLGEEQKSWFLERLRESKSTWKIWGNTLGTLDGRVDPQNLPPGLTKEPWPNSDFGVLPRDFSTAYFERGEIYDFVRENAITGFVTVAGDRHSFWAGLSAKTLPPKQFAPVGIAFITGSISAPGTVEAYEHKFPQKDPLRPLFLGQGPSDTRPQPTVNMMVRHGVKSCLEYAKSGDIKKARALSNPELSPHLNFVDWGGHGYAVVRAASDSLETEFVCIPRPIERSNKEDGGPLLYRVRHKTSLWRKGEAPKMKSEVLEGDPRFSI